LTSVHVSNGCRKTFKMNPSAKVTFLPKDFV
jgi:hypothetical protein